MGGFIDKNISTLDAAASVPVPAKSRTYKAGGTIVAKQVVMFDLSQSQGKKFAYVIQAATVATGQALAVGIALAAATAEQDVEVAIKGYVASAVCSAGVTQGEALCVIATAGSLELSTAAAATAPPLAVALADVAAGVADVWLYDPFGLDR